MSVVSTLISELTKALNKHCENKDNYDYAASASIVIGNQVVYSQAAGIIQGRPATPDTCFTIASISKLVIAVLCCQCHVRSELSLDADINAVLPRQVRHPLYPEAAITMRHLLTHSSGLVDGEQALLPGKWRTEHKDHDATLEQYVYSRLCDPSLWRTGPASRPGQAAYHYSNAGFTLLGYVLSCATSTPLSDLANMRIFEKLDMNHTCYALATIRERQHQHALPHWRTGHDSYGVAEWPAAQLRSSLADLNKFLQIFTVKSESGGGGLGRLGLSETHRLLMQPESFTQGLAWWGRDSWYGCAEGGVWEHGGFMQGVRTHMWFWPAAGTGNSASDDASDSDFKNIKISNLSGSSKFNVPSQELVEEKDVGSNERLKSGCPCGSGMVLLTNFERDYLHVKNLMIQLKRAIASEMMMDNQLHLPES